MTTVTVCGKITCEDTIRSRAFLDKHKVPYTWVDVEKNLEGRRIAIQKNPKNMLNTPIIVFQDGSALVGAIRRAARPKARHRNGQPMRSLSRCWYNEHRTDRGISWQF